MSRRWSRGTWALIIPACAGMLAAFDAPAPAPGLTDAEFDGYLAWLAALAAETRHDGQQSGRPSPLYPFDLSGGDDHAPELAAGVAVVADDEHGHHEDAVAVVLFGRDLLDLEHAHAGRGAHRQITAQEALRAARLYRHAAQYDSALVWYERARHLDGEGRWRTAIGRESLAAAVALGDSIAITNRIASALTAAAEAERRGEVIIGLRYLIAHRDEAQLQRLVDAVGPHRGGDPQVTFWLAYAHGALGQWPTCLVYLRDLLGHGEPPASLGAHLRAWVLVAVPDMLFLTGETEAAAPLYRSLAASGLPGVAQWAQLQVANLSFLAGDYRPAHETYRALQGDDTAQPWLGFAGEMSRFSENLTRIGVEGDPHGTAHGNEH